MLSRAKAGIDNAQGTSGTTHRHRGHGDRVVRARSSGAAAAQLEHHATHRHPRRRRIGGGSRPTVLAAASLTKVFPMIDSNAKYTFGGSGALQTQIEQGAPADVFAAASPKQPAALYAKELVDKPVEFATNTLVLIVPKSNPAHITSVNDITKPGVKLVICNATVPCGDYARTAFENLGINDAGDEERRQPDDRGDPDRGAGRDSARPTPALSTSPTPKPPPARCASIELAGEGQAARHGLHRRRQGRQESIRGPGVRARRCSRPKARQRSRPPDSASRDDRRSQRLDGTAEPNHCGTARWVAPRS